MRAVHARRELDAELEIRGNPKASLGAVGGCQADLMRRAKIASSLVPRPWLGAAIQEIQDERVLIKGRGRQAGPADAGDTGKKKGGDKKRFRYKPDGLRKRRNFRGNTVTQDTRQINLRVVESGKKPLATILGAEGEEASE